MKPYPRYKSTGLAWLPSVPEHWKVVPFKSLFSLGKGLPITKADLVESGTPVVSYGQIHAKANLGTHLQDELLRFVPNSLAAQKPTSRVGKGDFIFADTSEDLEGCGNFAFMDRDDMVYAGYHSIIAFAKHPEHGRYLSYLFQSPQWRRQIRQFANGVKVYSVTGRILNAATVTLPDSSEQDRIVRYLDEKTAAIDELVRAKEREIELLRERKQALVTAAVTGGAGDLNTEAQRHRGTEGIHSKTSESLSLCDSVLKTGGGVQGFQHRGTESKLAGPKFRDSGIPWIGKIPKHWEVVKTGHLFRMILGKMLANTPSSPRDTFEKYACAKDVHFSGVNTSDLKEMWFSPEEKELYRIKKGDLLIVEGGAGAGGAAIVEDEGEYYIQNSLHLLRPKHPKAWTPFLKYWIYSLVSRGYIDHACNKATIPHFTKDKVFNMPMPLPPLPEQRRIVEHLDGVCSELDAAEAAIRKQISLLQELRTRLVSDAVTGAVEV